MFNQINAICMVMAICTDLYVVIYALFNFHLSATTLNQSVYVLARGMA